MKFLSLDAEEANGCISPAFGIGGSPLYGSDCALAPEPAAEPAAEPSSNARPNVALSTGLILALRKLVRNAQRAGLATWMQQVRHLREQQPLHMEADSVTKRQLLLAVGQWHARRRLDDAFAHWRRMASRRQARKAVNSICDRHRARALASRAFTALAQHVGRRRKTAMRAQVVCEDVARQREGAQAVAACRAWSRYVARAALRRRGGEALARWLRSSRLRRWLGAWRQQVQRVLLACEALSSRAGALAREVLRALCIAWREVAGLERILRGHDQVGARRLGSRLLAAWRAYLTRAVRARTLAEHASAVRCHRAFGALHTLRLTRSLRRWLLLCGAVRTWRRSLQLIQISRRVIAGCEMSLVRSCLGAWQAARRNLRRLKAATSSVRAAKAERKLLMWASLRTAHRAWRAVTKSHVFGAWRARADNGSENRSLRLKGAHCRWVLSRRAALSRWSRWARSRCGGEPGPADTLAMQAAGVALTRALQVRCVDPALRTQATRVRWRAMQVRWQAMLVRMRVSRYAGGPAMNWEAASALLRRVRVQATQVRWQAMQVHATSCHQRSAARSALQRWHSRGSTRAARRRGYEAMSAATRCAKTRGACRWWAFYTRRARVSRAAIETESAGSPRTSRALAREGDAVEEYAMGEDAMETYAMKEEPMEQEAMGEEAMPWSSWYAMPLSRTAMEQAFLLWNAAARRQRYQSPSQRGRDLAPASTSKLGAPSAASTLPRMRRREALEAFAAWRGATLRAAALAAAVSSPSAADADRILCVFSAWLVELARARAAKHVFK